jgi:predicted Fe-Mo cluster-binding NifX family protein
MKTAFTHWENRIAPVFDTARQLHIIETEAGQIVGETRETLFETLIVQKALRLVELEIHTLVCGAISRPIQELIAAYGIRVIPFVAGDLHGVIRAWLNGNLARGAFAMPGCRRRGKYRPMAIHYTHQEADTMNEKGRMNPGRGKGQGQGGRAGTGRGMRAGGDVGSCVCPKCGHQEPHKRGEPCFERNCPKCGIAMTRQ